jgi:hypothetical protein
MDRVERPHRHTERFGGDCFSVLHLTIDGRVSTIASKSRVECLLWHSLQDAAWFNIPFRVVKE